MKGLPTARTVSHHRRSKSPIWIIPTSTYTPLVVVYNLRPSTISIEQVPSEIIADVEFTYAVTNHTPISMLVDLEAVLSRTEVPNISGSRRFSGMTGTESETLSYHNALDEQHSKGMRAVPDQVPDHYIKISMTSMTLHVQFRQQFRFCLLLQLSTHASNLFPV